MIVSLLYPSADPQDAGRLSLLGILGVDGRLFFLECLAVDGRAPCLRFPCDFVVPCVSELVVAHQSAELVLVVLEVFLRALLRVVEGSDALDDHLGRIGKRQRLCVAPSKLRREGILAALAAVDLGHDALLYLVPEVDLCLK